MHENHRKRMSATGRTCRNSSFPVCGNRHPNVKGNENDDSDGWWSTDSASNTGSYYSDSNSSIAEWESKIAPTGELFYIESATDKVVPEQVADECREEDRLGSDFKRRRSIRAGKFAELMKRKEGRRFSGRHNNAALRYRKGNCEKQESNQEAGEIREITVQVDPERRHKLGRRATLCEVYFGITPGVFADNIRVMVCGFAPDGVAIENKNVRVGDWLRRINSREVTSRTLEHVLSTEIIAPTSVKLTLQGGVSSTDVTEKEPPGTCSSKVQTRSPLAQRLLDNEIDDMEFLSDYPVGVIYLKTTDLLEANTDSLSTLYVFPRYASEYIQSTLRTARGAFVTLNHLLPGIAGPQPISTTMRVSGRHAHVVYTPRGEELLLIAFPHEWCNVEEAVALVTDIVGTLEFTYQSLSGCFTGPKHRTFLDHFFWLILQRLSRASKNTRGDVSKEELEYDAITVESYKFESSFSVGNYVDLPRDAQMQIDAALNEMEAMDYRDWNEEPVDCQRLYTILGSCVYHKSYLLGSHLAHKDFVEIQSFLRHNGILHLVENEAVKCLVLWRRVYPPSWCDERQTFAAGGEKSSSSPARDAKWFLLVVGYGHDLLAVLLESGGCTARYDETTGPDVFYVEEAQETLKHMQRIGVTVLAEKWIASAAGDQSETCADGDNTIAKLSTSIAENLLGFIKSPEVPSLPFKAIDPDVNPLASNRKDHELEGALRLRNNHHEAAAALGSANSLQTSDDSLSQGTGAVSEMSDEALPILGRRATREKANSILRFKYSDDSDSDLEVCKVKDTIANNRQTRSEEMFNIRENLLNQAGYAAPKKLIAGEQDYLFHSVRLVQTRSMFVSLSRSSEAFSLRSTILRYFHRCVHVIHRLLHNAVRFKKMLNQDAHRNVINKSLIAIKEHGVLFQWEKANYWVVGRLYTSPTPKELYVCYRDCIPQNLIEIEFNLDCF